MNSQQTADLLLSIHQISRSHNVQNTSDILAAIESKGSWLKQDAKFLADFVAMLKHRRDYETLAEAAMDDAERELIAALQSVRQSRAAYNAKPLEHSRAA